MIPDLAGGHGLRDSPDLVRKRQGLREVLEGVAPHQMLFSVEFPALTELFQQLPRAENLQRARTASIGSRLVCQFHMNILSVFLNVSSLRRHDRRSGGRRG